MLYYFLSWKKMFSPIHYFFVFITFLKVKNRLPHSMHSMRSILRKWQYMMFWTHYSNFFFINCLWVFTKMTFTNHLIFTCLAGVIFRPLFTTFCSFLHVLFIIFLGKITFSWYCTWCFIMASTTTLCSSLFSHLKLGYPTLCMLWHLMLYNFSKLFTTYTATPCSCYSTRCFITFLGVKRRLPHSMHIIVSDIIWISQI